MSVVEPRRGQAEADPSQIVGELYREARRDMGQSPDEDLGATGEVSARALLRMGLIVDAYAVSGTEELLHVLLERGPVVCGMTWRQSMFEPQVVDGQLVCTAGQDAPVVGGHCVVLNGVDLDLELAGTKGFVRFKNSWARGWGDRGHALLSLDDLAEVASSDQQTLLAMPARMFLEPWALPDVAYADVVSKLPMGENGSNLGWNFLEKIVHVPLNLPEMRGSGKKGFVGTLFRHVEATPPRSDGEKRFWRQSRRAHGWTPRCRARPPVPRTRRRRTRRRRPSVSASGCSSRTRRSSAPWRTPCRSSTPLRDS